MSEQETKQTICEKHRKFAAYWESLGKPGLEVKSTKEKDCGFVKIGRLGPQWLAQNEYRLSGDRHWILRKKWIDSDFKLPIEVYESNGWRRATPDWNHDNGYRVAPEVKIPTDKDEEIDWRTRFICTFENERLAPCEVKLKTIEADVELFERSGGKTNTEDAEDTGAHYRFVYRVSVTPESAKQGYVDVKLDPFRIAVIYNLTDFALQTILKKTLCAGNRGHNDLREDLKDIICAAKRKLEMLDEDAQLTKTTENKEEP